MLGLADQITHQLMVRAARSLDLIERIQNGDATFAELAQEFSSHASAVNGGDLGYLHQDMLENVAQQAVDKLKVGELRLRKFTFGIRKEFSFKTRRYDLGVHGNVEFGRVVRHQTSSYAALLAGL